MASDVRGVAAMAMRKPVSVPTTLFPDPGAGEAVVRVRACPIPPGTPRRCRPTGTTSRSAIRLATSQAGSATRRDALAARAGPGGHRRRWCHRHQRRLPPGHARLVRCRPVGAGRAHVGDHLARRGPHHLSGDGGRDRTLHEPLLTGPLRAARGGDRTVDRIPRRGSHLRRHESGPDGCAPSRGEVRPRIRG